MELFNPNSNVDFLGGRKVSIVLSALLVLVSIGLVATRGLNYALDFTGGVLVEAKYEQPVEVDQVRNALETGGFHSAQVQSVGGAKEVSIRLQPQADHKDAEQVGSAVIAALKVQRADVSMKNHPALVGSSVGAELRNDGIVAAVFVMLGIMRARAMQLLGRARVFGEEGER